MNIKLCDFGWSGYDIKAKRSTFCGTYQYMAPEMLIGKSYDYRVDIWGLGILLYELVHGEAPFAGDDADTIKQNLKKGFTINQDLKLSKQFPELLRRLLQMDVDKRISLTQVFEHPWVKSMKKKSAEIIKGVYTTSPSLVSAKLQSFRENLSKATHKDEEKTAKRQHHKTNSVASQIILPKDKNISINFLINNYADKKKTDDIKERIPASATSKKSEDPWLSKNEPIKAKARNKLVNNNSSFCNNQSPGAEARIKSPSPQDIFGIGKQSRKDLSSKKTNKVKVEEEEAKIKKKSTKTFQRFKTTVEEDEPDMFVKDSNRYNFSNNALYHNSITKALLSPKPRVNSRRSGYLGDFISKEIRRKSQEIIQTSSPGYKVVTEADENKMMKKKKMLSIGGNSGSLFPGNKQNDMFKKIYTSKYYVQ